MKMIISNFDMLMQLQRDRQMMYDTSLCIYVNTISKNIFNDEGMLSIFFVDY